MKCPITYEERTKKRVINPNAKFILIGNVIDGFLNFRFHEFRDFSEVKIKLFRILNTLECGGEWEIRLYQVEENYKIRHKFDGNYRIPTKGKLIYSHSYMDHQVKQITFEKNTMIVIGTFMDYWENWLAEGSDFHNYELDISVLKVKLK